MQPAYEFHNFQERIFKTGCLTVCYSSCLQNIITLEGTCRSNRLNATSKQTIRGAAVSVILTADLG